jgi:hypothetical protein
VDRCKFTSVSEVCTASIIRAIMMALMMEAIQIYEMLINLYQSARRYNPEDSHFQKYVPCSRPELCSVSAANII